MSTDPSETVGAPPAAALIQLVDGYWASQAVHAAAALGVADHLAGGPQESAVVARAAGADPDAVHRLLRALATLGVVTEGGDARFALTPLGDCLRSDRADSLRPFVLFRCGYEYPAWGSLLHSVRTGDPAFDHVFGATMWDYLAAHPDASAVTNAAMAAFAPETAAAVTDAYDFGTAGTVVDVGGGNGTLLAAILQACPGVRGIVFDQPHVVAEVEAVLRAAGVAERCATAGGDFFSMVPEGADIYLMKWILHDWSDADAVRILRRCREAMHAESRLLIVEAVLPERAEPGAEQQSFALDDLTMLVMTQRGRERTAGAWRALLDAASFSPPRIIPTAATLSILEAAPAPST